MGREAYYLDGTTSAKTDNGCHCSTAVGVLLLLVAVAAVVGVGLAVHFLDKEDCEEPVCDCTVTVNETLASCVALATGKNEQICTACESATTIAKTTPVITTTPITTTTTATTNATATVTATATSATTVPPQEYPVRLPGSLSPINYRLILAPNFYSGNQSEFIFNGSSTVLVKCMEDTSEIRMHILDLNLAENSIFVREENGVENLFQTYEIYTPAELIIIHTKMALVKGRNYTIEFTEFWAPLTTSYFGLYLGQYKENGTTQYHVATQMEPTFARMAFPCFDEPAMKATFDITLARKGHVTAISNMPVMESSLWPDGWVHDRFELSPVMSTYLVAFIIGDFTNTSVSYKGKLPITVWSRRDVTDDRALALDIAPTLQEYFEAYFGVEYDLPKMDMIGIQTFLFAGMENWGAIIYYEQYLLFKEGTTMEEKLFVILVVAHEIAHNWFGNLVTMTWWDDLWLNEAFATYMEYVGINVITPNWKPFHNAVTAAQTSCSYGVVELHRRIDEEFDIQILFVYKDAMPMDEKVSSHPIYVEGIETADEIFAVFDAIVYVKGGHVVRMLANLLGDAIFSKGLNRYMIKHMYGNARHQDLWEVMQTEVDLAGLKIPNLPAMMNTWIYQMGFPTVHVNFTEEGKLLMTQSRFLKDSNATDPGFYTSAYGYKWDIPFTFTSNIDKNFGLPAEVILMNHTEDSVMVTSDRVPSPTTDNWVIANIQSLAFVQVNYDQRNWEAIIKQLKTDHTVIHSINRMQLIHDSWNLAKSGDLGLDTALRISEYIRHEREFGPWSLLSGEWSYIARMLRGNQLFGSFRRFVRDAISPAYAEFSSMASSSLGFSEIMAKDRVLDIACRYGVKECINYVSSVFATWMENPQNKPAELSTDIADAILCHAMRNGEEAEFEFLLGVYVNASGAAEKTESVSAMACTQHPWLVERFTRLCLDGTILATDVFRGIVRLALESEHPVMIWDWFRTNFDVLQNILSIYTGQVLDTLVGNFNNDIRLKEIELFAQERNIETNPAILNAKATVSANIEWMRDSLPVLQDWLTDNGY